MLNVPVLFQREAFSYNNYLNVISNSLATCEGRSGIVIAIKTQVNQLSYNRLLYSRRRLSQHANLSLSCRTISQWVFATVTAGDSTRLWQIRILSMADDDDCSREVNAVDRVLIELVPRRKKRKLIAVSQLFGVPSNYRHAGCLAHTASIAVGSRDPTSPENKMSGRTKSPLYWRIPLLNDW